jgi:hypothetical protein
MKAQVVIFIIFIVASFTRSLTNTPEMIGFTVNYKNGIIDHVDKSWLALGNQNSHQ